MSKQTKRQEDIFHALVWELLVGGLIFSALGIYSGGIGAVVATVWLVAGVLALAVDYDNPMSNDELWLKAFVFIAGIAVVLNQLVRAFKKSPPALCI